MKRPSQAKTGSFKKICSKLSSPIYKIELLFVISSADIFRNFNKNFQKSEPLIHILYNELKLLVLLTLVSRVCKNSILQKLSSINYNMDIVFEKDNLLPLTDIVLSDTISIHLNKLKKIERLKFLNSVQNHIIACCKHLVNKSSFLFNKSLIKHMRFLQPDEQKKERSCLDIIKIAQSLPFDVPIDCLVDEWKLLQLESMTMENISETSRIDYYWRQFIYIEDSSKNLKYPIISEVIKASLSLTHGNADVERNFSNSGRVLTDEKTAMSLRMLNARLYIKDSLKLYSNKPELVPFTKELLSLAKSANSSYKNYLEEKKKKNLKKKPKQKKMKIS